MLVHNFCEVKGVDSQVMSQLNAPKAEIRSRLLGKRCRLQMSNLADFYCIEACNGHG
jgi:hypothetical protein